MRSATQRHGRIRWIFAVVATIAIVGIGTRWIRNEPRYGGRPVSDWFDRYAEGDNGLDDETLAALRTIGTNAVPFLIKRIQHADSRVGRAKLKLWRVLPSFFAERLKPPMDPYRIRMMAIGAIRLTAPQNYESAIPLFVELINDPDANTRRTAVSMLGMLERKAEGVVPTLVDFLNDSRSLPAVNMDRYFSCEVASGALSQIGVASPDVMNALSLLAADSDSRCRLAAANALWKLGAARDKVLPIYVNALTNKAYRARERALHNLSFMGPAAESAIPEIRMLLNDPESRIRSYASNAIVRIQGE